MVLIAFVNNDFSACGHTRRRFWRTGSGAAIADFGWLRIPGAAAWFAWLFVHILFLIGFRNRLVVMIQWAWAYFSYQRNVRLITGVSHR